MIQTNRVVHAILKHQQKGCIKNFKTIYWIHKYLKITKSCSSTDWFNNMRVKVFLNYNDNDINISYVIDHEMEYYFEAPTVNNIIKKESTGLYSITIPCNYTQLVKCNNKY